MVDDKPITQEKTEKVPVGEKVAKPLKESKARSIGGTLMSLITLVVILVLAYLAVKFLVGSDFNIDTLLTGSKSTPLPKLP